MGHGHGRFEPVFRGDISQVGIAPLTSMYFFGANDRVGVDDYRGEVHDFGRALDLAGHRRGLVAAAGQSDRLRVRVFADENPRGFGLLQRGGVSKLMATSTPASIGGRILWVEPKGAWGSGSVS